MKRLIFKAVGILGLLSAVCFASSLPQLQSDDRSTIKLDLDHFPAFLDPAANMTNSGWYMLNSTSITLFAIAEDQSLIGMLAQSWRSYDGGRRYEITIRKDAFFHDGSPITVEDVIFSLKRKQTNWPEYVLFDWVDPKKDSKAIRMIDKHTLEFNLSNPYEYFLFILAMPGTGVVPRKIYPENEPYHKEKLPVLGGPYKFVEWKRKDYVKLQWHEQWFEPRGERAQTVIVYERDDLEAVERLLAGTTDIFLDKRNRLVEREDQERVKRFQQFIPKRNWSRIVYVNAITGPLKDKTLRLAFAAALIEHQHKRFGNSLLYAPSDQFFPPGFSGRIEAPLPATKEFTAIYARLREEPLTLRYMYPDVWNKRTKRDLLLINDLSAYGFQIEMTPLSRSSMKQARLQGQGFDLGSRIIPIPPGDPCLVFRLDFGPDDFYVRDPNDGRLYKMIEATRSTGNTKERIQMAREISRYMLEEGFVIPYYFLATPFYASSKIDLSHMPEWEFNINFADMRLARTALPATP